jgi:hypothetical protein
VRFYDCENRYVTLREEYSSRVFENMGLRRTFGPNMEDVTRGWKVSFNEDLHNILFTKYFLVDQLKENEIYMLHE